MIPYGRQCINDDDIAAVTAVLRGDWLTTGPQVAAFEADLSEVADGASCTVVSSGTAALHTAYAAAGVGPNDEVITSAMTFVATAATAIARGASVTFADVEPDTLTLSTDAVAAVISDRTKAVTGVDYAGQPCDYDALRKLTEPVNATLIADAAHAIGTRFKDRAVGTLADITTFSFFPTKNLTTAEGGAVATLNPQFHSRAQAFRSHGLVRDKTRMRFPDEGGWHQEVTELGLNYRLPDVLCALGRNQLSRLQSFKKRRTQIFDRYTQQLAGLQGISLPIVRPGVDAMWHLYAIRVHDGRRKEVYDRMREAGIGVQVNYIPVYWHPVFADAGYRRGLCPNAEKFYAEELSLPMFVGLTDDEQEHVIETLWTILD